MPLASVHPGFGYGILKLWTSKHAMNGVVRPLTLSLKPVPFPLFPRPPSHCSAHTFPGPPGPTCRRCRSRSAFLGLSSAFRCGATASVAQPAGPVKCAASAARSAARSAPLPHHPRHATPARSAGPCLCTPAPVTRRFLFCPLARPAQRVASPSTAALYAVWPRRLHCTCVSADSSLPVGVSAA